MYDWKLDDYEKNKKLMNIDKHCELVSNYIEKKWDKYLDEINKKKSLTFHLRIISKYQAWALFKNYINLQENNEILIDQQVSSVIWICSILKFFKIAIDKINEDLAKKFFNNTEYKKLRKMRNAYVHPEYFHPEKRSIIPNNLFGYPKRIMTNFELSYQYDSYYEDGGRNVSSRDKVDIFDSFEKVLEFLSNEISNINNQKT